MSASYSVRVSRLEQAAIHNNFLFENIKQKRDALLAKKQRQLLNGSLQAVRNLSSLLDLLASLKCGPPRPWSEQQAKIDKRCSDVQNSWYRLDAAFNSTLSEYDGLAQELKTLHNDVFLKDRERTNQLRDQIARELAIVRDQVDGAQGHIDALEHRLVALTDEMRALCKKHNVKVDSAAAAVKGSWICLGAGIGCWLLEPVFPPAGILGWALMTGSYGSSATSLVFTSKAKSIQTEIDAATSRIKEAHGMLQAVSTSEFELSGLRAALARSQVSSKALLKASEAVFASTRNFEVELLGDHERSLFFILRMCKFVAIKDTMTDSLSIDEAMTYAFEIGTDFIQAARKVHLRSSLDSVGKQSGAKALLELEDSLVGLAECMDSQEVGVEEDVMADSDSSTGADGVAAGEDVDAVEETYFDCSEVKHVRGSSLFKWRVQLGVDVWLTSGIIWLMALVMAALQLLCGGAWRYWA